MQKMLCIPCVLQPELHAPVFAASAQQALLPFGAAPAQLPDPAMLHLSAVALSLLVAPLCWDASVVEVLLDLDDSQCAVHLSSH